MKIEHVLIILVTTLSFLLGGLTYRSFLQPKTISVVNAVFVGSPDSTRPKPFIGKPDRILPKVSKPDKPQNSIVANTDQPGTSLTPKPTDNTPKQEIESFKRFEDSLGTYFIKALADCAVKEFELQVTHKPFVQSVSECNYVNTFIYGTIAGTILTIVFEAVLYYLLK